MGASGKYVVLQKHGRIKVSEQSMEENVAEGRLATITAGSDEQGKNTVRKLRGTEKDPLRCQRLTSRLTKVYRRGWLAKGGE